MRAPHIAVTVALTLSLGACSSVRTVNGVEVQGQDSFCERRVERCVLLGAAAVVAAGAVVGLATGFADRRTTTTGAAGTGTTAGVVTATGLGTTTGAATTTTTTTGATLVP